MMVTDPINARACDPQPLYRRGDVNFLQSHNDILAAAADHDPTEMLEIVQQRLVAQYRALIGEPRISRMEICTQSTGQSRSCRSLRCCACSSRVRRL